MLGHHGSSWTASRGGLPEMEVPPHFAHRFAFATASNSAPGGGSGSGPPGLGSTTSPSTLESPNRQAEGNAGSGGGGEAELRLLFFREVQRVTSKKQKVPRVVLVTASGEMLIYTTSGEPKRTVDLVNDPMAVYEDSSCVVFHVRNELDIALEFHGARYSPKDATIRRFLVLVAKFLPRTVALQRVRRAFAHATALTAPRPPPSPSSASNQFDDSGGHLRGSRNSIGDPDLAANSGLTTPRGSLGSYRSRLGGSVRLGGGSAAVGASFAGGTPPFWAAADDKRDDAVSLQLPPSVRNASSSNDMAKSGSDHWTPITDGDGFVSSATVSLDGDGDARSSPSDAGSSSSYSSGVDEDELSSSDDDNDSDDYGGGEGDQGEHARKKKQKLEARVLRLARLAAARRLAAQANAAAALREQLFALPSAAAPHHGATTSKQRAPASSHSVDHPPSLAGLSNVGVMTVPRRLLEDEAAVRRSVAGLRSLVLRICRRRQLLRLQREEWAQEEAELRREQQQRRISTKFSSFVAGGSVDAAAHHLQDDETGCGHTRTMGANVGADPCAGGRSRVSSSPRGEKSLPPVMDLEELSCKYPASVLELL